jgi:hypothetical protein
MLQGNEHQHSSLRARVVGLMQSREDDFAPFVEDDQSFAAYTARMKKVRSCCARQHQQQMLLLALSCGRSCMGLAALWCCTSIMCTMALRQPA